MERYFVTELTNHAPSRVIHTPARNGYGECFTFYILPPGYVDCSEIPENGIYGVVYSPSDYPAPAYRKGWHYVHFKVIVKKIGGRYYQVQAERPLTEDERLYFVGLAYVEAHGEPELEMA
jgi:hypothetical protein